jgi:hypothetical protein
MNNPIQLVANDGTPLSATPSALEALNESQNVKVWLRNEVTSYTSRPSLSHADIAHKIQMLMGVKLVAKLNNRLVETSFGMAHHHAMTEEPIAEDFDLVYIYNVDNTDAGSQGYLHSQAGPSVRIINVERKVSPPVPTSVYIRVDKDVHKQVAMALKAIDGSWLTMKRERMAIGLPAKADLSDPNLKIAKAEFNNFMSHMDIRLDAAANSLVRGQNTYSLLMMTDQSPSVTTLPRNRRFKNVHDRRDLVRRMISIVPQMSFGINKMVPVKNGDRNSPGRVLGEVLQIFDLHTDISGAIDGLDGWFDGANAPFRTPDVVAITTGRVIQNLQNLGVVNTAEVDMNQVMTVITLNDADMLPINTTAPQRSVTTKKWGYVRDPDTQLAKKVVTTRNHKIDYARVGNKNVIFVPVDDGGMANNVAQSAGLTTLTEFDFAVPTGVGFTQNGRTPHGPVRQCTTFTNETGARYTLSCEQMKPFLHNFFHEDSTNVFDYRGMADADIARGCMMFFDEKHSAEGETVLTRNVYMRDNYYYNNDLMSHNVISVIQNRTAPALQSLFEEAKSASLEEEEEEDEEEDKDTKQKRKDMNKSLVRAIVENYLTKRRQAFVEEDFDIIYDILYGLSNFDAIEYLGYINMGFGVIWIKPMHVQSDAILFSRPSGFAHFGGAPTQHRKQDLSDESNSVLFQSVAYSTTSRQSLAQYPSVMWNNASYVESVTTTTNKIVDVTSPSDITDTLNHLHTTAAAGMDQKTFDKDIRGDAWFPLFCPPFMEIEAMSKPFNPLGRMGTTSKSEEEHAQKYTDVDIMDAVHPNVFTTNLVHQNMWHNFNTTFLYSEDLFRNRDFPFYKYIHFSPKAEEALSTTENAITRDVNRSINMNRPDAEGVAVKGESSISEFIGAAIPKTCWSDAEIDGVVSREDFKSATSYRVNAIMTNGDTSFYVNGDDFVGKWDRCGVSEYSFLG